MLPTVVQRCCKSVVHRCCKVAAFAMAHYAAKVVQRCCKLVVQLRVQIDIPDHKELDRGTLRAIIRQAELSVEDFTQ